MVDATFEVEQIGVYDVLYHHKAGGKDDPRSVNGDYHEGLQLLLERMTSLRATILGIAVDSGVARKLPPAERELNLPFPIELDDRTDPVALRLMITRAQKDVARRADVQPGGGNDQKRIRITIAVDVSGGPDGLAAHLSAEPSTHSSQMNRRVRTSLPTYRNLFDAGYITEGMVLQGSKGADTWQVRVAADGRVRLLGADTFHSLSALTNELSGHAQSAMRMWAILGDGGSTPLHVIRDRYAAAEMWSRSPKHT